MSLLKVVLLVWYSNTKIIFRLIKLIFGLKIVFKNWKYPIFDFPQSSCLTRYQKILRGSSFGCKNLLYFICHNLNFHNCHHTTMYVLGTRHILLLCDPWQILAICQKRSSLYFTYTLGLRHLLMHSWHQITNHIITNISIYK